MTIRDLGVLADRVRTLPVSGTEYKDATGEMAIASLLLEDSGALAQLLWWAKDVEPEPPPDQRGRVVEMRRR